MKLVEIKNSLAKLYYEPLDFKIVLSDFLTIDDGNQKILAQVVSIETTSNDSTNCAVLKFSLDLNSDGTYSSYSGYVPTLDSLVSLTPQKVLADIFSDSNNSVTLGQLTNSSALQINFKSSLLDSFLYVQADKRENKKDITSKILAFNAENQFKTICIDFDGLGEFNEYNRVTLGKEFKLPISSDVLNYIYENDLTGLTVEQKTIVQDIIIEIQEYIESLEDGFVPFDTLLDVVNEIYESDKSVGVILFRNKLLKYKQSGIFASLKEEIYIVENTANEQSVVVLDLSNADANWKNEALSFILDSVKGSYYLVVEAQDDIVTKEHLDKMYKNKNVSPVVMSRYDISSTGNIKAFAKNLLLYKPVSQQRAFATYNSFLNKLSDNEFIISGEATHYTPLIIKELSDKISYTDITAQIETDENINNQIKEIQSAASGKEDFVIEPVDEEIIQEIEQNIEFDEEESLDDNLFAEEDLQEIIEFDDELQSNDTSVFDESAISDILEDSIEETISEAETDIEQSNVSVEDSIARDVDEIFYTKNQERVSVDDDSQDKMVNINVDLSGDIEADEDMLNDDLFDGNQPDYSQIEVVQQSNDDEMLVEDDLDFIDSIDNTSESYNNDNSVEYVSFADADEDMSDNTDLNSNTKAYVDIEPIDDYNQKFQSVSKNDVINKPSKTMSVPVYSTELDNHSEPQREIDFAVGNIVYHEKYGRGVVDKLVSYGNKNMCYIVFDNIGGRLMDPQVADLKQM